MGINYKEIESNSVGNKIDYEMYSMDFEEFLWAKGYKEEQIEDMYSYMAKCIPLPEIMYNVMMECFHEYMVIGGMPEIVKKFIDEKNFSGILDMQKQIIADYKEDITKYAEGLDQTRILNVYNKIPSMVKLLIAAALICSSSPFWPRGAKTVLLPPPTAFFTILTADLRTSF